MRGARHGAPRAGAAFAAGVWLECARAGLVERTQVCSSGTLRFGVNFGSGGVRRNSKVCSGAESTNPYVRVKPTRPDCTGWQISFPSLEQVDGWLALHASYEVTSARFPWLRQVGGDLAFYFNRGLVDVNFEQLEHAGRHVEFNDNEKLVALSLPAFRNSGVDLNIYQNASLESISIPMAVHMRGFVQISRNPRLTSCDAGEHTETDCPK